MTAESSFSFDRSSLNALLGNASARQLQNINAARFGRFSDVTDNRKGRRMMAKMDRKAKSRPSE